MRLRKQALGNRNLIGSKVEEIRKKKGMKQKELLAQLQVRGVDMNASGLSKLEGQIRYVTDVELVALADILEVSVDQLLGREKKIAPSLRSQFARTHFLLSLPLVFKVAFWHNDTLS